MAEQEACTELVEKASQEQSSGALDGESQLLPLLQGLLEAPENEQLADSGIESGEDQRSGLIAEVQIALDKLSASLRSDVTDITPDRRNSLLQLVSKLQVGLASTTPKLERRLSSGPGRFNKKRDRHTRHTVGVSSEELADARRLIEEISYDLTPSESKNTLDLRKQNSESSVNSNSSFNKFNKTAVKNATAKPFSSSSNSLSNPSSSVQTPTETSEHLEMLFGDEPIYHEAAPVHVADKKSPECAVLTSPKKVLETNPIELSLNDINNIKSVHQAAVNAARKKVNSECMESETEEDDASTVKDQSDVAVEKVPSPLQENPIYTKPEEKNESSSNLSYEEKVNRFNTQTKKLKMKRANTIDIPKPLQFYEDDDSESEMEDEAQKRKNAYYALRGPIRVSNPIQKKTVPVFEPKTKSDQKFLEFISKNSQENDNKQGSWSHNQKTPVWGNKFGNLKNNFEKPQDNSVRSFWKTQDDASHVSGVTHQGPKISKRSARNLQQMFEEKQRESLERTPPKDTNVVTGSLTVKTEPEKNYKLIPQPLPVNKFTHAPQSAFKPIQRKNQQEELRPESKREILKTELNEKTNDTPLFLYSPKPLFNNSQDNSAATSPVAIKPWIANATEHGGRVVSLAAKKFEAPQQEDHHTVKPRKLSKDIAKVFTPQQTPSEKYAAPYVSKGAEQKNSTVRKLSAEYNSLGNKIPEYSSHTSVKYQPAAQDNKTHHYVPPYRMPSNMPQNFTSYPTTPQNIPKEPRLSQYKNISSVNQTKPSQYINSSNVNQNYHHYNEQHKPYQTPNKLQNLPPLYHNQNIQPSPNFNQSPGYQSNYTVTYQTQPSFPPQNYSRTFNQTQVTQPNYVSNVHQQSQYVPQSPPILKPTSRTVPEPQYVPQSPPVMKPVSQPPHEFQPVNYSIRYDQPGIFRQNSKTDPISSPQQFYQHGSGKNSEPVTPAETPTPEQEYVSTVQFSIKPTASVPVQITEPTTQLPKVSVKITEPTSLPPKYETQLSAESVHEYHAVSSKVMSGPVSQQAVTVRQKSPMSRNEHDMEAAFNLKNSLQQIGRKESTDSSNKSPSSTGSFKYKSPAVSPNNSFKYKQAEPQPVITKDKLSSPQVSREPNKPQYSSQSKPSYNKVSQEVPKPVTTTSINTKIAENNFINKMPTNQHENKTYGVVKPMQQKLNVHANPVYNNVGGARKMHQESLETTEKGQNVVHSKFHIPVINVAPSTPGVTPATPPTHTQVLSKSDSWHQICMASQTSTSKPSPRGSPVGKAVVKSKSSHSLAVPQKQFEAGMSKEELLQKRKTMEAYFSATKSPQPRESAKVDAKVVKRSINRIKTSEKVSTSYQPIGLSRSRTLPDIVCPDLLDESNVDKSFDDLFKSNS